MFTGHVSKSKLVHLFTLRSLSCFGTIDHSFNHYLAFAEDSLELEGIKGSWDLQVGFRIIYLSSSSFLSKW